MRFSFLLLSILMLTSACRSTNGPTAPPVYSLAEAADSVRVRAGQTVVVDGVRIRFNGVESDSRCPSDVVCVWEGDAVANFTVEQNCECRSVAYALALHTTLDPKWGVAYGYRVELRALAPSPRASSPIKPDAYVAWLRVVPAGG